MAVGKMVSQPQHVMHPHKQAGPSPLSICFSRPVIKGQSTPTFLLLRIFHLLPTRHYQCISAEKKPCYASMHSEALPAGHFEERMTFYLGKTALRDRGPNNPMFTSSWSQTQGVYFYFSVIFTRKCFEKVIETYRANCTIEGFNKETILCCR